MCLQDLDVLIVDDRAVAATSDVSTWSPLCFCELLGTLLAFPWAKAVDVPGGAENPSSKHDTNATKDR
jgi:hypothetical protein